MRCPVGREESMSADDGMRAFAAKSPVPEFAATAWTAPKPLNQSTVAIVTSAALHSASDKRFGGGDTSYRVIDRAERELVLGHWSQNFDRSGLTIDLNVVYPIDRLEELAAKGTIGAVAKKHYSFAGNQPDDVATLRLDSGPAAAAEMLANGVDVVILTPV
jgi:D-proline reductase (dithiol) PrdB